MSKEKVEECYTIAVDISENDVPIVQVFKRTETNEGVVFKHVNTLWGEEAIEMHHKLSGKT